MHEAREIETGSVIESGGGLGIEPEFAGVGALKEADAALALDADCLEAHAARATALLSLKRLIDACLAYRETTRRPRGFR